LDLLSEGTPFEDLFTMYLNSIYFAVVTITTIGYGDIHAVSNYEMIFLCVTAFIACANFGYTLNQIGCIIQE